MRRLKIFTKYALSFLQCRVVILLYHRIFEAPSDPLSLCITPKHFAEQLDHLRTHYQIISLNDLAQALKKKRLPRRTVVITFDDGYADVFLNSKPLLGQYEVPATVFIPTGYIGTQREFWWDDLERIFLLPEKLPGSLKMSVNGKIYSWKMDDLEMCNADNKVNKPWNIKQQFYPSSRHKVYKELHEIIRYLDEAARLKVISDLEKWAGLSEKGRSAYRVLTVDEIKRLSDDNLLEVGSHGINHLSMSCQSDDVQHNEIFNSKRHLQVILNRPVNSFAYPYGSNSDMGDKTINLVKEAGYKLACSTDYAYITQKSDVFRLPRYPVGDWGMEEFAHHLKVFFSTGR